MRLISPIHLIILVAVIMLLFGARRISELGRGFGKGVREFQKRVSGADETGREESERDVNRSGPIEKIGLDGRLLSNTPQPACFGLCAWRLFPEALAASGANLLRRRETFRSRTVL